MTNIDIEKPDWNKGDGLLPAIIQDAYDGTVLMLGYMNKDALAQTQDTKRVTFFSRSKNRLWMKGETSGNILDFISAQLDCDRDTILITARPAGNVCHTGTHTCFGDSEGAPVSFLNTLSTIIKQRREDAHENSYTADLFAQGTKRIAQKVGEEGVELSLAHMSGDKDEILDECADLLFHILVLLEDADLNVEGVCKILTKRHSKNT